MTATTTVVCPSCGRPQGVVAEPSGMSRTVKAFQPCYDCREAARIRRESQALRGGRTTR